MPSKKKISSVGEYPSAENLLLAQFG